MSTRFEKQIIMPRGTLGATTLLGLAPEDLASVQRWHRKEWDIFVSEIQAYKERVLVKATDFYQFNRDHCIACKGFKSWRRQRGSILLGAFGLRTDSAGCSFTASTIANLTEFNVEPTDSYTHARLHSDGDWYSRAATTAAWGSVQGTWKGDCAIADYDTRWNQITGPTENSANTVGTDGVYTAGTTAAAVGYHVSGTGALVGDFNLQCRDGTTLALLFTDSFILNCEVDARN